MAQNCDPPSTGFGRPLFTDAGESPIKEVCPHMYQLVFHGQKPPKYWTRITNRVGKMIWTHGDSAVEQAQVFPDYFQLGLGRGWYLATIFIPHMYQLVFHGQMPPKSWTRITKWDACFREDSKSKEQLYLVLENCKLYQTDETKVLKESRYKLVSTIFSLNSYWFSRLESWQAVCMVYLEH